MKEEMDDSLTKVVLTSEQFWLLASAHGPAYVVGIENPHLGWLADEIENAEEQSARSLVEAGWAKWEKEGEVLAVNDDLLKLVETCIKPKHTVIVTPADKTLKGKFIHFDEERIVCRITSEKEHHLQPVADTAEILELLKQDLCLDSIKDSHFERLPIDEEALLAITQTAAKDPAKAADMLAEEWKNQPKAIRERLLAALESITANSSLITIFNQDKRETQHTRGFGLLEGKDDLFLLETTSSMGKPVVEISGTNPARIRELFQSILPVSAA